MTMLLWQTGIAQETYNGMKVQREKDGVYLVADGDKIKVCENIASPIVAGVAALLYSVDPGITPAEVKSALIENADVISGYPANNDGWNKYVGYGLVNAGAAVSSVNENISK